MSGNSFDYNQKTNILSCVKLSKNHYLKKIPFLVMFSTPKTEAQTSEVATIKHKINSAVPTGSRKQFVYKLFCILEVIPPFLR